MHVVVIGTGRVGLVTAAALATLGHDVVAVDEDVKRIKRLRNGICPFFEPGLEELVKRGIAHGTLGFEVERAEAVGRAEVVFICVGTPASASVEASLAAVERAARGIAGFLNGPVAVVEKSTVPAGTAGRLRRVLTLARPDLAEHIEVVLNPEFLREGRAVEDALRPGRILVGARSPRGFEVMRHLYEPLVREGSRLIETDIATAELSAHAMPTWL